MTKQTQQLGKTLWAIANQLRGAMNADDFRDYMLALLFLRHLSDHYEQAAKKELGRTYPQPSAHGGRASLSVWYEQNPESLVAAFELRMRAKAHCFIAPQYLWASIAHMSMAQDSNLLATLQAGFQFIEDEAFQIAFSGLFSEINLDSEKLGRTHADRNAQLCEIVTKIDRGLVEFGDGSDTLGDAYEYLIGQFAAGSGRKAGEFYTPQRVSDILSAIVALDGMAPQAGQRRHLASVMDFACGSGSLLLNVRKRMGDGGIGKLYGQETNVTTYNLARMNMLMHGAKDSEFQIHHGDALKNDWHMLSGPTPAQRPRFDAVVANPPFSYRWAPHDALDQDARFRRNHCLAPKSAADFAFLLHGLHYLADDGVMAIILPHGVLFRGGAEARIRRQLLDDGHIDTVIGMPPKLFYSTGIPVCILVLKKRRTPDDILFINASEQFDKGKRQNRLSDAHIGKIVETYQQRPKSIERYARCVEIDEIAASDYNLNISRYVSTAPPEVEIDLWAMHKELCEAEQQIQEATAKHNAFLQELGLPPLPTGNG